MSNDKTPLETAVDQAMDAFLYAPIGLIFDGPALFPKLVQQGRSQVQVARMMGQMAVQMGQSELSKRAATTNGPVRDVLTSLGLVDRPADAESAPEPAAATETPAVESPAAKPVPKKPARQKPAAAVVGSLGIEDYDSLSASQVVQRLRGLVPTELDAVKAYESANRARKTVLTKITQLQKG